MSTKEETNSSDTDTHQSLTNQNTKQLYNLRKRHQDPHYSKILHFSHRCKHFYYYFATFTQLSQLILSTRPSATVKIRGILDIQSPYYCGTDRNATLTKDTNWLHVDHQSKAGSYLERVDMQTMDENEENNWIILDWILRHCILSRNETNNTSGMLANGNGYLEIPPSPESNHSSHLYDDNRQLEILFFNKPDKDIAVVGYKKLLFTTEYTKGSQFTQGSFFKDLREASQLKAKPPLNVLSDVGPNPDSPF
ncbi:hypothetical protein OUZ56_005570 [Daphnia magna]|uniref:Uncharacterized protein n=1 Tax=Daphnia magna TaxID=35525 RepID=A0ABQ9YT48_9CRUS|nr:hypothetical protein OUZ56_005570 [Daphnia magna]